MSARKPRAGKAKSPKLYEVHGRQLTREIYDAYLRELRVKKRPLGKGKKRRS